MNKRFAKILQYFLFLGLGLFFAWLSLKNLDHENIIQVKHSLKQAKKWLFLPVFLILILSHYIRALRWRLLIEPLGHKPTAINAFLAVMIGYLVNLGVPRLGEIIKCTILYRYEKIPTDKLIGTIIIERIIDSICLVIVFALTLGIQPTLYAQIMAAFFNEDNPSEAAQQSHSGIWVLTGILVLVIGFLLYKRKSIKDIGATFKKIGNSIYIGINSIRALKKRKQFIVLTILIWTLYLLGGYIGFIAFEETNQYGLKEAFTILSAGSIGMIASPGGIGAYAYLVEKTMQLYGLNYSIALAFGWLLWLAQTTVLIIGGIASFIALPFVNRNQQR
jgi:uncharacterized membrane protein YbhN (UPF0104 family)